MHESENPGKRSPTLPVTWMAERYTLDVAEVVRMVTMKSH